MTTRFDDSAADDSPIGGAIGVVGMPDHRSSGGFPLSCTPNATGFAAGTRILTRRGEVAVEQLTQDDVVVGMRRGRLAPVRRIGHCEAEPGRHTDPDAIDPVRVIADAFGPGRPNRDLVLAPDQALSVDGQLIAVRHLRNGATIRQERWDRVAYYHVELDAHDMLLANAMTAESFGTEADARERPDHAPFTALRQALLDRAVVLGHARTADPDLRVIAGGRVLRPKAVSGGLHFQLPKGASRVQIVSRSFIPNEMRAPDRDCRRLGVGVTSLRLDVREVALTGDRLGEGWHPAEPGLRWTNGAAWLRIGVARSLSLTMLDEVIYWVADDALAPAPGQPALHADTANMPTGQRGPAPWGFGKALVRACGAWLSALTSQPARSLRNL